MTIDPQNLPVRLYSDQNLDEMLGQARQAGMPPVEQVLLARPLATGLTEIVALDSAESASLVNRSELEGAAPEPFFGRAVDRRRRRTPLGQLVSFDLEIDDHERTLTARTAETSELIELWQAR